MLSTIVYGRNDSFSYELNRRTALGLNQLACQLVPGRDEIVFVDYNTDDDLPTHPEAIADTLTQRAIDLIRIIRVRPDVHAAVKTPGPPVREAFCRNIALRRLNPDCQWVLSTNPDCMLIADGGPILSDLVSDLPEANYGLPRFELPRFAWETLPRSAPEQAKEQALKIAKALHLEEAVRQFMPTVGYDAPGDFQLARKDKLISILGFNEAMTFGWHVDSNINSRLALTYGDVKNLNQTAGGSLKLFHAEHGRRFSAKHSTGHDEDSFDDNVIHITEAIPDTQPANWGVPEMEFESFPLSQPPRTHALRAIVEASPPAEPTPEVVYGPDTHDRLPRDIVHINAFLLDHLVYLRSNTVIGWIGEDTTQIETLVRDAELANPLVTCSDADAIEDTLDAADVLIFDVPQKVGDTPLPLIEKAFAALITAEQKRGDKGLPPRRVIALNAPHSWFEPLFLHCVTCAMTPVTTRIRYGEVKRQEWQDIDLLPLLQPGPAGESTSSGPAAASGRDGYFALCRVQALPPGRYRVEYSVDLGKNHDTRSVVDVALSANAVEVQELPTDITGAYDGSMTFHSAEDGLFGGGFELRFWCDGKAQVKITSARLIEADPFGF